MNHTRAALRRIATIAALEIVAIREYALLDAAPASAATPRMLPAPLDMIKPFFDNHTKSHQISPSTETERRKVA